MTRRSPVAPTEAVAPLRLSALCVAVALSLAACGGGSLTDAGVGTGGTGAASLGGVVIDGAIEGASVFLDLDGDLVRDDDEPQSGPSDAAGRFRIDVSKVDAAKLKDGHLVVHVPDTAKDADDGGKTLAEAGRAGFTLTAPAAATQPDRAVVSPLTTLVSAEMREQRTSREDAVAAVRARLGLPASADLTGDFVAARDTALGNVARAAAVALGEAQRRIVEAANREGGLPLRDQVEAATQAVQRQLPEVVGALRLAEQGNRAPAVTEIVDALSTPTARAALDDTVDERVAGAGQTRRYVVVFKDEVADPGATAQELMRGRGGRVEFTYGRVLKGFAVSLPDAAADAFLAAMQNHPLVDYVEVDRPMSTLQTVQTPVSWGLDRIDQRDLPLSGGYAYGTDGSGVRAYVLDTGLLAGHVEFGSRVLTGWTAVADGKGTSDCNGHGTHVAGTIGGRSWGVAKGVTLVPVRVLDCSGSGSMSGVIAGLDWVAANAVRPAVVNLSLGGGASSSLDTAVANVVAAGLPVVVAAGNSSADACTASPARAPSAITVGATTSADARAPYSNFGACLDVFAPGSGITSAWHTSTTAAASLSGTSMASPHVAGRAALLLAATPSATPAQVADAIRAGATPNAVTGAGSGSPNLLLYTGSDSLAPLPPPAPVTVSVASLAGGWTSTSRNAWRASVTVAAKNASGEPVSGAVVSGGFSVGGSAVSCTTGSTGSCRVQTGQLSNAVARTTFTVGGIAGPAMTYDATANAASSVVVARP